MKRKVNPMYLALAVLMLSHLLFAPTTVYASDAVADIMNSTRFQGAISSIEWLTTRVDYWFTMVITATGFFIISSSLFKNVCAGAYCSNHKFWDKVAEAHEKNESMQLSQLFGGGVKDKFMNLSTSSIKDAVLCIIPNIKSFTDFDDADIEPRQYWTKAIPQMLGCIMIGVFVYNGYYRDTAATVGNFGSEIWHRVFSSVDPAAWVDKLTQTTGTPDSIYDGDKTLEGQCLLQITKELYKSYLSVGKDISSTEAKTALMRDCENNASKVLAPKSFKNLFFSDGRLYDFTLTNLKITPCPISSITTAASTSDSKGLGKMTISSLDKETNSSYQCLGYYHFESSFSGDQIDENKSYFSINFIMKGSQKTDTKGSTDIIAQAGSWSSLKTPVQNVTIRVSGNENWKKEASGNTYRLVVQDLPNKLAQDKDLNANVSAWAADSISNCQGKVTLSDWTPDRGFNGTVERFEVGGIQNPASYTHNVVMKAVATYQNTNGKQQTQTITVQISITFTNK